MSQNAERPNSNVGLMHLLWFHMLLAKAVED